MSKKRVLFVCIHNSARSQMAAAYLRALGGDRFEAESAGLEPGKLNPLAVEAMRRAGIDISRAPTQSVFDLFKTGRRYEYVISVCDGASAERCPIFPGVTNRLNWSSTILPASRVPRRRAWRERSASAMPSGPRSIDSSAPRPTAQRSGALPGSDERPSLLSERVQLDAGHRALAAEHGALHPSFEA
jgi:arsenate reductase